MMVTRAARPPSLDHVASHLEAFECDEGGQLLQATLCGYPSPTALDVPPINTGYVVKPLFAAPHGAKGMTEGGGTRLMCLSNAVEDALGPAGNIVVHSHNTRERVRRLLHDTQEEIVRIA